MTALVERMTVPGRTETLVYNLEEYCINILSIPLLQCSDIDLQMDLDYYLGFMFISHYAQIIT